MDQLKPLLEHKFWILLALALILPVVAWWSMANQVSAQITTRESAIDSSFKALPTDPKSLPNKTWADGLKSVNQQRTTFIDAQAKKLWESQQKLFRLPQSVEQYRGPFRGKFTGMSGRDLYRVAYNQEVRDLRKIVDPLESSGKGIVYLPESIFSSWRVPDGKWDALVIPNDVEIWDAQEDIWLVDAILHAVKEVNEGKQSIVDASVKEIVNMRLRGGSRDDLNSRSKGTSSAAKTPDKAAAKPKTKKRGFDDDGGNTAVKDMMSEESGKTNTARGPGGVPGSMSFDLNEVFGGVDGQADVSTGSAPTKGDGAGLRIAVGQEKKGAAPTKELTRYIDNEESGQNFVTRGFFMYVIMDHREVPEFLASLSSMPFPTEILRVHVTKYRFDGRNPSFSDENPTPAGANPQGGERSMDPAAEVYSRAMRDPALANVAVAGMMTLYRPPGGTNAAAESAQKAAPPAQTPGTPAPAAVPAPATNPAGAAPAAGTPGKTPEKGATDTKGTTAPAPPAKSDPGNAGPAPAGAKPPEASKGVAPPAGTSPTPAAGKGS